MTHPTPDTLLQLIDNLVGAEIDAATELYATGEQGEIDRFGAEARRLRAEIERRLSTMVDTAGAEVFSIWYRMTFGPNDAVWMESSDPDEVRSECRTRVGFANVKLWRQRRHLVSGPRERWTEGEAR